jgi:hypothetical protein
MCGQLLLLYANISRTVIEADTFYAGSEVLTASVMGCNII